MALTKENANEIVEKTFDIVKRRLDNAYLNDLTTTFSDALKSHRNTLNNCLDGFNETLKHVKVHVNSEGHIVISQNNYPNPTVWFGDGTVYVTDLIKKFFRETILLCDDGLTTKTYGWSIGETSGRMGQLIFEHQIIAKYLKSLLDDDFSGVNEYIREVNYAIVKLRESDFFTKLILKEKESEEIKRMWGLN